MCFEQVGPGAIVVVVFGFRRFWTFGVLDRLVGPNCKFRNYKLLQLSDDGANEALSLLIDLERSGLVPAQA